MGLLQLPYGPIVYAANSTPASDHAANFLSPQEPNRQPGAFMVEAGYHTEAVGSVSLAGGYQRYKRG